MAYLYIFFRVNHSGINMANILSLFLVLLYFLFILFCDIFSLGLGMLALGDNNRTWTSRRKIQHKQLCSEELFLFLFLKLSFTETCLLYHGIFGSFTDPGLSYSLGIGRETSYFSTEQLSQS